MIEKNYKDDLLYFTIKGFGNGKLSHLFSTRVGWNQDDIFAGVEKIFSVGNDKIYRGTQVHKDNIVVIRDGDNNEIYKNMEFDGLITNTRGVALLTYHADCTPIYFYDVKKEVIGMVHSGWRGTLLNIAEKMILKMESEFSSNIEDIQVAIGPAICVDCYEVQADVYDLFLKKYDYKNIIKTEKGIVKLDVPYINKMHILNTGIREENLFLADVCTSCNTRELYSYRKERSKGRMIAGIILNEG